MYIDSKTYRYHIEFEVKIVKAFRPKPQDGGLIPHEVPQLTSRYMAAIEEDKAAEAASAAKEEMHDKIKRLEDTSKMQFDTIKRLKKQTAAANAAESAAKKEIKRLENELRQAKMHTATTKAQKPPAPELAHGAARKVLKKMMTASNRLPSRYSPDLRFVAASLSPA